MKNFKFIFSSAFIATTYMFAISMLMNISLVKDTFSGSYSFTYRLNIVIGLIQGMWTSMSGTGLFLLIATAILTGLNISILSERIKTLKSQGNLKFVVGGSSILGVISSGCAACGLPILAILGLGGSLAFLPLRGMELSYISILVLSYSLYLLLKPNPTNNCTINK